MNLVVKEYNKNYEINMGNITQILGANFYVKYYIQESIQKHFSLYKYQEYDERMEDNIVIDGDVPGRKEYKVININSRESIIEQIRIAKGTIMYGYFNNILETLTCQKQINMIDENLTNVYNVINGKLKEDVGNISIDYEMQNLLFMVSKSTIYTITGEDIERMKNYELLMVLLKLLKENNAFNPEKVLLLLQNIDHLCTRNEYAKIVEYLLEYDKNIYALLFTSIDKYVYVNKETVGHIIVFNDVSFQVPEYDAIEEYLINNYPVHCEFDECEIMQFLRNTLNSVGVENDEISYKDLLVKKLINKAICINDIYDLNVRSAELACFNA